MSPSLRAATIARFALVGLAFGAGLATLPGPVACGDSYVSPCRRTARRAIRPAPEGSAAYGPVSITEGAGETGAFTIVSWLRPPELDGGAPDGGSVPDAGALGGLGGVASGGVLVVPRLRLVHLSPGGDVTEVQELAAPSALASRTGSTVTLGASPVQGGALFHWIETVTTTAADGLPRTDARIVLQRRDDAGEGPALTPPGLACERCLVDVSFASIGDVTAALVTLAPDAVAAAAGALRRTQLVAFDRDGHVVAQRFVDRLIAPAGAGSLGIRLSVQRGLFLVRIERVAELFDRSLSSVAGPWALPTNEAELDLDPAGNVLGIVHGAAAIPRDGGEAPPFVGDSPDLVFEQLTVTGGARGGPHRLSSSSTSLDLRRAGNRTGVVHADTDGTFFALVEDGGHKHGGDLALDPAAGTPDLGDQPALFDRSVTRSALVPVGAGFVGWSAGVTVVREEIACDP